MAFVKCTNDKTDEAVVLADGEILFYENIDTKPTLNKALTKVGLYKINNGETKRTTEYFSPEQPPKAFVSPNSIKVYSIDNIGQDQVLSIDKPSLNIKDYHADIKVSGSLSSVQNGNYFVTPEEMKLTKLERIENVSPDYEVSYTYNMEWQVPFKRGATRYSIWINILSFGFFIGYYDEFPVSAFWDYSIDVGMGGSEASIIWDRHISGTKDSWGVPKLIKLENIPCRDKESTLFVRVMCQTTKENRRDWYWGESGESQANVFKLGPAEILLIGYSTKETSITSSADNSYSVAVIGR